MRLGRLVTALLTALIAASVAIGAVCATGARAAAPRQTPDPTTAQLQGSFVLEGHVTVATNVRGEHVGQRVVRRWSFTPSCPTGPCPQVALARDRQRSVDLLELQVVSPGFYRATGVFYAPLRCGGRIHRRGEEVPFTITVRITAAAEFAGVIIATAIHATYVGQKRINLTRCVLPPTRDAAVYNGQVIPA
jgi:hypothetical protein